MDNVKALSLKQRTAAIIAAGALAASTMFAPMAFATTNSASATGPDSDGTTDLYVQIQNPDEALAHNFSVTVPATINYVAAADGTLTGPNGAAAMNLDNNSLYPVYASHLKAAAATGWNVVGDAANSNDRNAISVSIGTSDEQISIANALTGDKGYQMTKTSWNMQGNGAASDADKVVLSTTNGKINNVDTEIANAQKFATLTWYVTPGALTASSQG